MQDAITFELPISKAVVTMKGFLTTGQSRELQRILLSKGEIDATGTAMKNIAPETALDMQDKAAELLVTEIKQGETIAVFSKEWLYELPMEDGNLVYDQVNKIIGAIALPDQAKKK